MFLALATLLGTARILGELTQRLHQPAVLGELLAGVLLGPTILGTITPSGFAFLFPRQGPNAIALESISLLAIVLFLLVAGMEVDLSTVWRQGRVALKVGAVGMLIPFVVGLFAGWYYPEQLGRHTEAEPRIFALFLATALAISALPVIAKTLLDLGLYRTDMGMIVVSAAILDDLIGWTIFSIVLGLVGANHNHSVPTTIALTLLFAGGMLTLGRWAVHRLLPYLQAYTPWPGGVLSFALTLALLGAACTEWIGVHAIFGSFVVGVVVGDSSHLRERTRVIIDKFVSFIFAPVFFASIGLKVNFFTNFDGSLVLSILLIACVGKFAGAWLGARWGGVPSRDSWAIAFAMNSRGAMEIILGVLALQAGLIDEKLFVALVIMAITTSMMSGPAMGAILRHKKPRRLVHSLGSKRFLRHLSATTPRESIHELIGVACEGAGLDPASIELKAWAREETLPTGIGNGVAIPHARVADLRDPVVAVGISEAGIDFDAPDGEPAHVIFLILTPQHDRGAQLELAAEIARLYRGRRMLDQTLRTQSYTEFLALMNSPVGES